ncbi:MAG: class I SAM-dependent DNA methyltransferase, partial [Chloroflexi bacterium]|nr:class I SAM-dependent DNA methyltransferase [Chloroflexota bacterium]
LRQDKGMTPYNLRNCAYHEAFSREKLYWRRVARDGLFSYVEEEIQCVNAAFMLNGKSLKYLCAVLNTKLISWLMRRLLPTSGTGTFHWEKVHVERLPVPLISTAEEYPYIRLVERILLAKASSQDAQVDDLEHEVSRRVYEKYELTQTEIIAVENATT